MTALRKYLDAVRQREQAATKGPWEWTEDDQLLAPHGTMTEYDGSPGSARIIETDSGVYPPFATDRAFIAAARTDVPTLLRIVEALDAKLGEVLEATSAGPVDQPDLIDPFAIGAARAEAARIAEEASK